MEIPGADEEQNKRWLTVVKEWVEREKDDAFSILFVSEECSLFEDFKKHEEKLVEYLISLDGWLKKYGIKKALKEMPSVGMLLSQLCKVPLALISGSVSKALINCIIHLSNILHHTDDDDTASKRAKKWAIDHFSTMISVDVEGVDMILMEEFGISPEEYLREHVYQSSLELLELSQHRNLILKDVASLSTVFEFLKMVDDQQLTPAFEATVSMDCSNILTRKQDNCLLDAQLIWISENTQITSRFSIDTLHVLFKRSIASFENYIICIVEEITDSYPGIHQETIEKHTHEARLFDLCSLDVRYYLAIIHIIKDSFLVIGVHHGLVEFLRTFVKKCKQMNLMRNVERHRADTFQKYNSLDRLLMKSTAGWSMEQREDNLRKIDEILSKYTLEIEKEDVGNDFEIWFKLLQYGDWVDEAILLLFDGSRQNVSTYLQLIFRFLCPTEYDGMVLYVQPLTSYVYALRNLLPKNHIQLSDLEFLLSSLKRKLPPDDIDKITVPLTIISVIFLAKSCGGGPIADKYLEHILDVGDDHTIYWFLYTIQLLLKQTNSLSFINKPTFKDTLAKRLNKLQFIHENNGDTVEHTDYIQGCDGDKDQVAQGSSRRENICLTCYKIKRDLDKI